MSTRTDWLVAAIALYGACLSTWTAVARRPKRRRQREALDLLTVLLAPIERDTHLLLRQVEEDPQGKHAYDWWGEMWPTIELLLDRYDAEINDRIYKRKLREQLTEIAELLREMERARKAIGGLQYFLRCAEQLHDAILNLRQESRQLT